MDRLAILAGKYPKSLKSSGALSPESIRQAKILSRVLRAMFCAAVCTVAAGCGESKPSGEASNRTTLDILPARVCVTAETSRAITKAIVDASRSRLRAFGHPFKYEDTLDHLTITISNATLESFDSQTKKATCKATITYSFSPAMDVLVKANQESTTSDFNLYDSEYTIQPAADDTHLIYDFESVSSDYPGYVIQQLNELDSRGGLKQG